jgi:hypothetical protein
VLSTVLEPLSKDALATTWAVSVEAGLAIAQAMLAGVDEGLGVGLHAFNAAGAKDVLKVPDHWGPDMDPAGRLPGGRPQGGGQRPRRPLSNSYYRGQYGAVPVRQAPGGDQRLAR